MKNVLMIGLIALFAFTAHSQTLKQYNGSFNFIVLNSSTPPNYNVTGFFNDFSGQSNANGLTVGDIFFDVKGDRYEVISITSAAASNPGVITMVIESINPGTPAPQAGVGMLNKETENLILPLTTANLSENLQSIIQTHMALKIDTEAGGGGNGTITDGKNALFVEEDSVIVLGGIQDRNTLIQGTEDYWFTLQNKNLIGVDTVFKTITNRGNTGFDNGKAIILKVSSEASDQLDYTNDSRTSSIRLTPNEVHVSARSGTSPLVRSVLDLGQDGGFTAIGDSSIFLIANNRNVGAGETRVFMSNGDAVAYTPKPSNGSALSLDANGQVIVVESGAGSGPFRYTINDGAAVTASGLGVTYSVSDGVGTFTIPEGVLLFSARVKGETADLSSNNFVVEFDYGAEGNNTDNDDVFPASIQIINSASEQLGGPTSALPFVHDLNTTVQVQLIDIDAGKVVHRFVNLNAISDWYLLFTF